MKPIYSLAIFLGSSAVILGIVSGTFFGIDLRIVDWQWIKRFRLIMLDSNQLFNLALVIGAVQITFGMIIRAIGRSYRFGFSRALRDWGWLILVLGLESSYILSEKGYMNIEDLKIPMYIVGGVSVVLIFLLNNIKRNPLINVGAGLWGNRG